MITTTPWGAPLFYIAAAAMAVLLPESRFPQELYQLRQHGKAFSLVWVVKLFALWTLVLIPWVATVRRYGRDWSWKTLALPLFITAAMCIWVRPPITQDVLLYACQGRQVAVLGVNPYQVPLAPYEKDAIISTMSRTWFNLTSTFGPLALAIYSFASIVAPKASLNGLASVLKAFWLLPFAGVFYLFWQRWSKMPERNAMMLAMFANPMFMVFVFLEGHVDIVFLLFLLQCGLALERYEPAKAALWLCAATTIKFSSVVMVPGCACWMFRRDKKKGLIFFLLFLAAYGLCAAMINAGDLRSYLRFASVYKDPSNLHCFPRLLYALGQTDLRIVRTMSDASYMLVIALLCLANLTGRGKASPFATMAIATAALYFTRTYTQPWYTFWFWPLLCFTSKRPAALYLSVGFWTIPILLSMCYPYYWKYGSWLELLGFLAALLWLHKVESPSETHPEQSG